MTCAGREYCPPVIYIISNIYYPVQALVTKLLSHTMYVIFSIMYITSNTPRSKGTCNNHLITDRRSLGTGGNLQTHKEVCCFHLGALLLLH